MSGEEVGALRPAGAKAPDARAGAPAAGGLALLAVCLGFFMVLMDTSALNVALPEIRSEFAGTLSRLEWTVNGYTIPMAASLLSGGAIADRWGARRVFQYALLLFVLASAACALSPGLGWLVAARVAQGVAAGGLLPASLAVIAHGYPDPAARSRALTVWGGVSSLALVLGPVVGGALTAAVSWRAVFLINVPIGLLAMALTQWRVARSPVHHRAFDPAGQALAVALFACGVGALIEGGEKGWRSPVPWILLAVTGAALLAFALVERAVRHPLLPPALLGRTRFTAGLVIGALFQFGAYGAQFALSLHLQNAWGLGALGAGLAFVPFASMWTFASFVLARAVRRTGPRPLLAGGALAAAAGAAALLPLGHSASWGIFTAGSCLLGLGAGLMGPSLPTVVLGELPSHHSGLASGALNAFRQVGGALGIALFGLLLEDAGRATGLRACLALVALGFLAAAGTVLRSVRPRQAASAGT
ncbi:MFS transporter [Streptomyces physcomitrii]|uniref:MFS transporter n=1 Tax=Streptomyces physcomitrii TaxID=2724184 RepID=UPI0033D0243B